MVMPLSGIFETKVNAKKTSTKLADVFIKIMT